MQKKHVTKKKHEKRELQEPRQPQEPCKRAAKTTEPRQNLKKGAGKAFMWVVMRISLRQSGNYPCALNPISLNAWLLWAGWLA